MEPSLQWFVAVWLTCVGGCVGSFMNVVVYRLPEGLSVVHPGSRCPRCGHAIRGYDNLPVLSWLILRGRCRDCRAPISARYPLVEALVAGVFLVLLLAEVFSGGANLPDSPDSRPPLSPALLWTAYGWHLLLLCSLICAALIQYDGKPAPAALFGPVLLMGLILPMGWFSLRPVPLYAGFAATGWQAGLAEGLAGLAVGGLLGVLALPTLAHRHWPAALAPAACGVVLGWQAAAALAAASSAAHLVSTIAARAATPLGRVPWMAWLTVATGLYLVFWQLLVRHWPWLGSQAGPAMLGLAAVAILVFTAGQRWLRPSPRPKTRQEP